MRRAGLREMMDFFDNPQAPGSIPMTSRLPNAVQRFTSFTSSRPSSISRCTCFGSALSSQRSCF